MQIVRGDIFKLPSQALAITTNGIVRKDGTAVMGAGIAKVAAERYPGLAAVLGDLLTSKGNQVYLLHRSGIEPWGYESRDLVAFPTKNHWREPSSLELIKASALQLVTLAEQRGWKTIVLPQPGCGLGGLDWETQVRPVLEPLWDDRFVVSMGL